MAIFLPIRSWAWLISLFVTRTHGVSLYKTSTTTRGNPEAAADMPDCGEVKKLILPLSIRLRGDRGAHLNVLDIEPGFCIEPFFLSDIEWQSRNRRGRIADANFLHGLDPCRTNRREGADKNQQRCDQNFGHHRLPTLQFRSTQRNCPTESFFCPLLRWAAGGTARLTSDTLCRRAGNPWKRPNGHYRGNRWHISRVPRRLPPKHSTVS